MSLIDPGLLQILCCPQTHQPLSEADAALVGELNQRMAGGALKNRAGQVLAEKLEGGLLRRDRQVLYPVRHRLPVLLVDEAILIS
jgi:uncharacterized protein YbaR (Trm112 family)